MARPGQQTHAKRVRESLKRDKRRAKDERRAARKAAKTAPDPAVVEQPDTTEAPDLDRDALHHAHSDRVTDL